MRAVDCAVLFWNLNTVFELANENDKAMLLGNSFPLEADTLSSGLSVFSFVFRFSVRAVALRVCIYQNIQYNRFLFT
jgi:hypothetical protein